MLSSGCLTFTLNAFFTEHNTSSITQPQGGAKNSPPFVICMRILHIRITKIFQKKTSLRNICKTAFHRKTRTPDIYFKVCDDSFEKKKR